MPKKRRILARRTLEVLDASSARVSEARITIYCPESLPNQGGFRCVYSIEGIGSHRVKDGRGSDAIQAVIHTLAKIGIDLYKSPESQAGHLRWCGETNLGFPVFEAMASFVPGPTDTLVM